MTDQPPVLITAQPVHGAHALEPKMYITCWRKTPDMGSVLDWDFQVTHSLRDADTVVRNICDQGVHQYFTYVLGEKLTHLSSEY